MIRIAAIVVPVVVWLGLLGLIGKYHYRKNFFFFLLTGINLLAIWQLMLPIDGNYLWMVLLAASVVGALVAWLEVLAVHDLLFRRYWHRLCRVLVLATTCWWLAAIYFSR